MAYVTTDQSITNTTTMTDVTDLVAPLDASSIYKVEVCLHFTAAPTTTRLHFKPVTGWTGRERFIWDGNNMTEDAFVFARAASTATNRYINITAIIHTDGAGDLQLQFGQGVANATATTIGIGSYLIATKLN